MIAPLKWLTQVKASSKLVCDLLPAAESTRLERVWLLEVVAIVVVVVRVGTDRQVS